MKKLAAVRADARFCCVWLGCCAPAWATSRCPPELGPKDPLVNLLGWLVVAVAATMGVALCAYVARRSRGMRWLARVAVLGGGLVAALLVTLGGFALAYGQFFLRC